MKIDHLVVMASSLEDGVAWCERTLGIRPGLGGEHPLMGTHNRLFNISTANFPRAYCEIIALNPKAAKAPERIGARWFDMDDLALKKRIDHQGPQLVHWVARVGNAKQAVTQLKAREIERGEVLQAARPTDQGLLTWQITVREDGQRLFDGCLPTLIEWGPVHPAQSLPESGVSLVGLSLSHPQSATLRQALNALGNDTISVENGSAGLHATLQSPKGLVSLYS